MAGFPCSRMFGACTRRVRRAQGCGPAEAAGGICAAEGVIGVADGEEAVRGRGRGRGAKGDGTRGQAEAKHQPPHWIHEGAG